jgi:hypothetical protein
VHDEDFARVIGKRELLQPLPLDDIRKENVVCTEMWAVQFTAEIMDILGSRAQDADALQRRKGIVNRLWDAGLERFDQNNFMLQELGLCIDEARHLCRIIVEKKNLHIVDV